MSLLTFDETSTLAEKVNSATKDKESSEIALVSLKIQKKYFEWAMKFLTIGKILPFNNRRIEEKTAYEETLGELGID